MKKLIYALILAICAVVPTRAAVDYEFYVVLADSNVMTISNADVEYISFEKVNTSGSAVADYTCQVLHMKDGTTQRLAFNQFRAVVISDMITESDSVVDLGLSVKWRNRNYGSAEISDYGTLVGWGDPTGLHHEQYHTSTYGAYNSNKNNVLGYYGGLSPADHIAGTSIDIAHVKMGDCWQLPTMEQCQELINKCRWMWIRYRGAEGVKVVGPNGNSIFLPAAGMRRGEKMTSAVNEFGGYWTDSWYGNYSGSSSATKGEMSWALAFGITGGGYYKLNGYYRYSGLCIRPVYVP